MTNIEFSVNGQEILKKNDVTVVEKSRGEYKAVFALSDDWASITDKRAYFTRRSDGLCRTADLDDANSCLIPWECIELPSFFVSVAGGNLRTVTKAEIFVSETGYREDAEKSGSAPEVIRTPQGLTENNGVLSLVDKNGNPIGVGAELPSSGFRHINTVTIDDTTSGATAIKINKDEAGKAFSLSSFAITARIVVDAAVTGGVIRLRTDGGTRYLYYQDALLQNGAINIAGNGTYTGGVTFCTFGISSGQKDNQNQGIIGADSIKTMLVTTVQSPIRDVEVFLLVGGKMQPLLAGSMLSISGV